MENLPSREQALALLHEHTDNPGLRRHAYAVEAAMRAQAARLGGDPDRWGLVGLLHDFDYERWPDPADHPFRGAEILERLGYPEWFRRAILSHADHTGVARTSDLERALYASDELSGFLTACALVMPHKSLHEVKVSSVRKRLKDKAFARGVKREDVERGAAELGVDLDAHIAFTLEALRAVAADLGLHGEQPPPSAAPAPAASTSPPDGT
jgi:putative nucleotidyltransferase with HDIG domain